MTLGIDACRPKLVFNIGRVRPPVEATRLNHDAFTQRLRRLIGRDCSYRGKHCRLIEILVEEHTLVLEVRDGAPPIHTDQYGRPNFRANELIQLPIFRADPEQLSDELLDLLSRLDERDR
jgi:hypothetical protein